MNFFFINSAKFETTKLSYQNFDEIIKYYGYKLDSSENHFYFKWEKIENWQLNYEDLPADILKAIFIRAEPFTRNELFTIRLNKHLPIVKIKATNLAEEFENICREVDYMGWEAISENGKYILEFSDESNFLTIANFELRLRF